jgi:hypothetical protein
MTEEMSLDEYHKQVGRPARSKYGNIPCTEGGYIFASGVERDEYVDLLVQVKGGLIKNLKPHPPFELIPAQKDCQGKHWQNVDYVADFSYDDLTTGRFTVEDVKSKFTVKNALFVMKWKLLMMQHPDWDFRIVIRK